MDSIGIGNFLKDNAIAIILVSIIFSIITIYIIIKDINFQKRYIKKNNCN